MIINGIHMEGFGKFSNEDMVLSPKINLIYGENEAGKSTINHFLLTMFSDENVHGQYVGFRPWYLKDTFRGSIHASINNQELTITKDFLKSENATTYVLDQKELTRQALGFSLPITSLATYKLSNFVGKHLVSDLKQKISNKTITNSEHIDINQVFEAMNLDFFSSNHEHQISNYMNNNRLIHDIEEQLKGLYQEIKLLYGQQSQLEQTAQGIARELMDIEAEQLLESTNTSQSLKEKLEDLARKIHQLEEMVKGLEAFAEIELETYETYLDLLNQKERIHGHIVETLEKIDLIRETATDESIALNRGHRFLTNENYVEDFILDIEQYKLINQSLLDLNQEINQRKEKMYHTFSIKDRYEDSIQLQEDYQKLLILEEKEKNKELTLFDDNNLIKSRHKRFLLTLLVGIFGLVGIGLLILSSFLNSDLGFVLAIDIGIALVFCSIYAAYKLYSLQLHISKIEYVKLYQSKRQPEKSQNGRSNTTIEEILAKYQCSDSAGLEALFLQSKEAELTKNTLEREIGILDVKYIGYNNQIGLVKRRIEKRMHQCEFKSEFSSASIEDVEQEFNDLLDAFHNTHVANMELEEYKTSLGNFNKQLCELEQILDQEEFQFFKSYSYQEIYDNRQKHLTFQNEIQVLKEAQARAESGQEITLAYEELKEKKNQTLERDLENQLVRRSLYDQTFDTEKLIKKMMDKKRSLVLENLEVLDLMTYQTIIKKVQGIIIDNMDELKTSKYPAVNKMMNQLLFDITGKYSEIHIDDGGDIMLTEQTGEKVNLENLSLGTIDQIYFIMGICMIESVYDEHQSTPLILDDAFVQYDDDRFENVMKVISQLERQIIIFTCYEREYEYFVNHNIDVNYIQLESLSEEMEDDYV